jgi:sulfate transport system ATP-binding protein
MSFMGRVDRFHGALVRPHDVELRLEPNGTTSPARVRSILHLGFEVRVELELENGDRITSQLSHAEFEPLDLVPGQPVWARPRRTRQPAAAGR